ncbi:MAG TPA: nucleotidyltransferase family protein, partial [Blastocatellia bacterium]
MSEQSVETNPTPFLPMVTAQSTIREVMTAIDTGAKGIALVVDDNRRLLATLTDGDVRRALLAGHTLNEPTSELLALKAQTPYPTSITAEAGTPDSELIKLMTANSIRQVPLVGYRGEVVGLATLDELAPDQMNSLNAVIMAGGFGTRLRPLTEDIPKPMLPIGGRPLIEHIVDQLSSVGITHVNITTHYKAQAIVSHLGDGEKFGLKIDYINEERPLGTVGSLAMLDPWESTLLVINGDILTRLNFRALLDFHRENRAMITVGVRPYELQVPYGVIDVDGASVKRLSEKPTLKFFVNAGIYLLEPEVYNWIRNGHRLDMTDLVQSLLDDGERVASFPISEY